jgi:hypothetical protein
MVNRFEGMSLSDVFVYRQLAMERATYGRDEGEDSDEVQRWFRLADEANNMLMAAVDAVAQEQGVS